MTLAFPTPLFPACSPREAGPFSLRPVAFAWNRLLEQGRDAQSATSSHIEIVQPATPAEAPEDTAKPAEAERFVLVVDDEMVVREVAVKMLRRNGFQAIEAADGAEALRVFEDRHSEISAVLMDLVMPVMGGEEAFRAIRKIDSKVPVIFSSGYSAKVVRARCGLMRPDGILQKPYQDEQLVEALRQAF